MRRYLVAACCLCALALPASALDYRSVGVPAAILFDTPSKAGKKLFLIRAQTPVEVLVRLEGWVKVRDAEGTLAWIEARNLAEQRMLQVTAASAEVREAPNASANVLLSLAKGVVVEYLEAGEPGWVKVRHRDGVSGFIRNTQVWGL